MHRSSARPPGRRLARAHIAAACLLAAVVAGEARAVENLTLDRARALALERNPDLAAGSEAVAAGAGRVMQAGLVPNPRLQARLEDAAGSDGYSGARRAESTIEVVQRLELGGKRSARRDLALQDAEAARVGLGATRARLLAEVDERFGHVLGDQAALALRRHALSLAEDGLAVVEAQFRSGRLSAIERHKASAEVARARIAEEHAEHELRSARRRLSALWDAPEPEFTAAEGELAPRRAIPSFEDLERRLGQAPEIERAAVEIAARGAALAVARAEAVPDVDLSAGIRRYEADDDVALVMGLSVPLPLFDRGQGTSAAARAELRRAEASRRAALARLRSSVYGLLQELRHADTELTVLDREVAVEAAQALTRSREAFELGRLPFLELLDAQRTFVAVEERRIETAVDLWRLRARLERAIGGPLP